MTSIDKKDYKILIDLAFQEDLDGDVTGDVTSNSIFTNEICTARLISRDNGILAGSFVFKDVFIKIDKNLNIVFNFKEGDNIKPDDCVAIIYGKALSILKAERTALNFLSFISGIATKTRKYINAAKLSGNALILDTRKTLPGYRVLSKYAVFIGGGKNHRKGLYDMVLIKDNHIDVAGSITKAVALVKKKWQDRFKIEVECRTIMDVNEALECNVDIVMLDNMEPEIMEQVVSIADKKSIKFEASGGINLKNLKSVIKSGVDYISVGALTHSVTSFDFSLIIDL